MLDATVLLVDPETGFCVAVVDGGLLTAYRTASASAIATRYLARKDSHVLGLVGLGVEGRSHLDAIRLVRDIDAVVGLDSQRRTADPVLQHVPAAVRLRVVPRAPSAVAERATSSAR